MAHEFDPLGFAAAERRTGLAELEISQARVTQSLQRALELGHAAKKIERLVHRHFEHLRDSFAAIFDFDFLSLSLACKAGRRHSRTSVLLPEPLTPVTSTNRPSGKLMVRSLRLFFFACRSVSQPELDFGVGALDLGFTARRWPLVG